MKRVLFLGDGKKTLTSAQRTVLEVLGVGEDVAHALLVPATHTPFPVLYEGVIDKPVGTGVVLFLGGFRSGKRGLPFGEAIEAVNQTNARNAEVMGTAGILDPRCFGEQTHRAVRVRVIRVVYFENRVGRGVVFPVWAEADRARITDSAVELQDELGFGVAAHEKIGTLTRCTLVGTNEIAHRQTISHTVALHLFFRYHFFFEKVRLGKFGNQCEDHRFQVADTRGHRV
jgi:hypothetical protein